MLAEVNALLPHVADNAIIEDDCWIGARATILPGVRIGRGSTVAAGAVVSKDVEAGTVVSGVPAKVIKKLSDEPQTSSKGSASRP